jgi:hypothetical protein
MSYTKTKGKTQERSDAKNCRRFTLKLTRSTDADIIALLENKENKQGYIKALIRRDLEQKKGFEPLYILGKGVENDGRGKS